MPRRWRYRGATANVASFAFVVAALSLIGWITLKPAPVDIEIEALPGNYPEGTQLYGTKWKTGDPELNVVMTNNTEMEYGSIDAFIWTDAFIDQAIVRQGINQCIVIAENPFFTITGATLTFKKSDRTEPSIPNVFG